MLKYGNRDFRSLQEQVYANMRNIEDIIKGQDIMADYTLQIVGQVDTAAELPDAETYDGKLGDIYVVGTESPFDGYAFVKVYENENVPSWVDLGPILVQGPQGEQGPQGPAGTDGADGAPGAQGPQGDQGVPAGFGVPTASIQGGVGTPNVSITASGPNTARVFDFTFYNLKGEKGDAGAGVQDFSASDAGKSLVVNSTGTATEWDFVGLSPEDQAKLDNSLQLPESAPVAQQLVGINTSGEQNALGIGDGLTIEDNNIKLNTLTIDFAGAQSFTVSDDVKSKISNGFYDQIIMLRYANINAVGKIIALPVRAIEFDSYSAAKFTVDSTSTFKYKIISPIYPNKTLAANTSDWDVRALISPATGLSMPAPFALQNGAAYISVSSSNVLTISKNINSAANLIKTNGVGDVELTTAGGTVPGIKINIPNTGTSYFGPRGYANSFIYYYKEGNDYVILRPVQYIPDAFSCKITLVGEHYNTSGVKDYTYIAQLDCTQSQSQSSYTLTRTAV